MKKDKIFERRLELSSKFLEMGQALIKEGKDKKDYSITQSGSFIILIAGLILEENDIYEFSNLCSMFSAKKLLDGMEESNSDITNFLKNKADSESYDDFIRRINKLRGGKDIPEA
jgi:hypothetical protein